LWFHSDKAAGDRDTMGFSFAADIDHMGLTTFVKVRESAIVGGRMTTFF
jgi:hypothetical protein